MRNNKYLNLILNILFFLLAIILWSISISIIIVNDKIKIIIIPYIIFEILFVINLIILFVQTINFKEIRNYLKTQEFYLLIAIFIINIFILNGCIGAAHSNHYLLTTSSLLWTLFIFSFTFLFCSLYYLVYWKIKIWSEQKNLKTTKEQ